ncbi:exonuclease domain-containing protein [Chloroflexota bacterium]
MLNNINLERPIAFIDLETTGLKYYADCIVEFSVLKIRPDGTEEYKSRRVNPEMAIPSQASSVHGITNADLEEEPTFRQLAKGICEFMDGCDLSGFNILDFDLPLLENEFKRAGIEFSRDNRQIIDTMTIYHKKVPYDPNVKRNLEAAYLFYCNKELLDAHSADSDVRACAEILDGQLDMYDDLPREVFSLCSLCSSDRENYIDIVGKFVWLGKEASFNFGKHKGRLLREISSEYPDYLEWILGQDFSPQVMGITTRALNDEFPER